MTPTYEEWLKIYYSEAKQVTIRRGLHDNVWRTESELKKRFKKAYKYIACPECGKDGCEKIKTYAGSLYKCLYCGTFGGTFGGV